jgi:hypothetical protein
VKAAVEGTNAQWCAQLSGGPTPVNDIELFTQVCAVEVLPQLLQEQVMDLAAAAQQPVSTDSEVCTQEVEVEVVPQHVEDRVGKIFSYLLTLQEDTVDEALACPYPGPIMDMREEQLLVQQKTVASKSNRAQAAADTVAA